MTTTATPQERRVEQKPTKPVSDARIVTDRTLFLEFAENRAIVKVEPESEKNERHPEWFIG